MRWRTGLAVVLLGLAVGARPADADAVSPQAVTAALAQDEGELRLVRRCLDKTTKRLAMVKAMREKPVPPTYAGIASTSEGVAGSGVDGTFKPGSFGTCAVLGNGPSLSGLGLGNVIDLHDTVIRHSVPLNEHDYGKRTDVLIRRTCDFSVDEYARFKGFFGHHNTSFAFSAGDTDGSSLKAYLTAEWFCTHKGSKTGKWTRERASSPFRYGNGVPVLYWDCLNTLAATCKTEVLERQFKACTKLHHHNPKKPTSGWKAATFMALSGLCTSLDLYGFSTTGTAKTKYWEFAHASSDGTIGKPFIYKFGSSKLVAEARDVTHSLDLEYEWWRALMRAGNTTGCPVRFIEAKRDPHPGGKRVWRRIGNRLSYSPTAADDSSSRSSADSLLTSSLSAWQTIRGTARGSSSALLPPP